MSAWTAPQLTVLSADKPDAGVYPYQAEKGTCFTGGHNVQVRGPWKQARCYNNDGYWTNEGSFGRTTSYYAPSS